MTETQIDNLSCRIMPKTMREGSLEFINTKILQLMDSVYVIQDPSAHIFRSMHVEHRISSSLQTMALVEHMRGNTKLLGALSCVFSRQFSHCYKG